MKTWGVKRFRPKSEGCGWHWYTNELQTQVDASALAAHYQMYNAQPGHVNDGSIFVACEVPEEERARY